MTETVVFDSQSLLKLYLGEPGAQKVATLLRRVLDGEIKGYLSVVNLAEVYYILHRRNRQVAEEKEKNLGSYGVRVVSVSAESGLWKRAASLKEQHSISLADAFAAATAMEMEGRLVTGGDTDFDGIPGLRTERV